MKVLALVIFAVASVSGLGSGPYLPSGWRPQGPAFYLPSEVQKPADNPLKETIFQESEASGSDALREYGPPKVAEVSQDLTSQSLPDAVTEQAFVVIAKVAEDVGGEVREISEVKAVEEVAGEVEVKTEAEAVTEAIVEAVEVTAEEKSDEAVTEAVEENTTAALESAVFGGRAIDVAIEETVEVQEATTETVETTTAAEAVVAVEVTEAVVDSNVESSQVEQVSQVQEVSQVAEVAEVRTAEEGAKEVADALVNLENEIKAQQVQNEDAVEVKSVQVLGTAEVPEGFLEYGPPGFREYGPPQADELLRSGAVVQEPTEEEKKVENNETRRRRFSPKFRPSKKHH